MISLRHVPPTDEQIIQRSLNNPGMRFEYINGEITGSPATGISGVRQSALNFKSGTSSSWIPAPRTRPSA